MTVLQFLTYKLSLKLFSLSSMKIHIRMANFTWVSGFPGAAPNLNSQSVAILRQEHSVNASECSECSHITLKVIEVFSVMRPSVFD